MPAPRATRRPPASKKSARWRWRAAAGIGALACLAVLVLFAAYWAATRTPEFYRRAVARDEVRPERQGDELERRTLELRNSARRPGEWTYVVDEDELNGWLAQNLMREFPRALPELIEAPRAAIGADGIRVGGRYRDGRLEAVLSLELDVYLTDDSRAIAVELKSLRAGLLPLPMHRLLDPLQEETRKHEAPVRWRQQGPNPVALWAIPERPAELGGRRITVNKIELRKGQIVVTGRSE